MTFKDTFTPQSYIISLYPLGEDYLRLFREKVDRRTEQVSVSSIPAKGYFGVFAHLYALRADTVYLAVPDEADRPLLPILGLVALVVRARRRWIVEPDFSKRAFGLAKGLANALIMAGTLSVGLVRLVRNWFHMGGLLNAARIPVAGNGIKRVLYLKDNFGPTPCVGGSVAHTRGVIGGILANGYDVDVAWSSRQPALPRGKAIETYQVPSPEHFVIPGEVNHYAQNSMFVNFIRGLNQERYGFIYQRISLGNFAGVLLSRLRGLPLILEYNGSEVWLSRNWGRLLVFEKLAERVERVCLKHAHMIVTVSETLREELITRGVEENRIVSHPNGVDTTDYDPNLFSPHRIKAIRERYGFPPEGVIATFVGTFGQWHGAEILAGALKHMSEDDPEWLTRSGLHVAFVGDGTKKKVVEEILSPPGLRPYYTLTGLVSRDETPALMAASDILVSPHVPNPDRSPFFGSPIKLFEYLASGRAVIASDLAQIRDVLDGCPRVNNLENLGKQADGTQCGVLVPPNDEVALATALRFLTEEAEWRTLAGQNARKLAVNRYTWDHHVSAFLSHMEAIVG